MKNVEINGNVIEINHPATVAKLKGIASRQGITPAELVKRILVATIGDAKKEKAITFTLPIEDFKYHLNMTRDLLTGHFGGEDLEGEELIEHVKACIDDPSKPDTGSLADWNHHFRHYLNLYAVAQANGIREGVIA